MHEGEFQKRYAALNAAQKEAVDAIEGPVMVVAGPGTGKTQILTLRIANILEKTDTEPENILALTFTEAGAATMRRRLLEIVGAPAYSVVISTFHGFCNSIIKEYPEEFPRIIGSESITEVEQVAIIEELIDSTKLEILKPFGDPLYYTHDILKSINDLKREDVDPDTFAALVARERERFEATPDLYHEKGPHKGKMKGDYQKELKTIEKNAELATLYRAYEARLEARKLYDYGDMIMEVLRALEKNKDLLLILQEEHQYILVDEHQDTNNAQNKILELLANFHATPNIFVVGDEKQAIFRFQGASLENFLYFKKLYPEAKLVVLEENYRSTQAILDSAHTLIPGKKELKARAKHKEAPIRLFSFMRPEVEEYFVAKDIRTRLDGGAPPSEIAVLYRNNRDAIPLARALGRAGIPFVVESDESVLGDDDIKKLIVLLRAIDGFGSEYLIAEALHVDFLGLDPLDVYRVIRAAGIDYSSIYDVLRSDARVHALGLERPAKMRAAYGMLSTQAVAAKNKGLQELFQDVVRESGLLAHCLGQPDMVEKMERLNGLFDEVQKLTEKHPNATLHEFLEYVETIRAHDLLIKKSSFGGLTDRVRLMTAHKSKGQEFAHVYIVNAFDGHWGNKRKMDALTLPVTVFSRSGAAFAHNPQDDERRLFYVALTRAQKSVTISYARESISGREQLPTQFIEEMRARFSSCSSEPESFSAENVLFPRPPSRSAGCSSEQEEKLGIMIEEGDSGQFEKMFVEDKGVRFAPRVAASGSASVADKTFIRELFLERGLSATALNNYLTCPWRYFYQNLLRIPAAKEPHQLYGTAVHAALDDLFDAVREGAMPTREFVLERFRAHFAEQPFREKEREDWLARGEKALGGYYDEYHAVWPTNVRTEFDIKGILLTPEIKLSGKIDKLEIADDGREVNVVDYKTGKPKTRGVIEGATANSNGDIKRQLVFYNLLLNSYEKGRFHMISADVDFVEPDEKGRYKKERFTIAPHEVEALSDLIKTTAGDIFSLSFWDARCDDKECEYCALREMMG